MIIGVIMVFLVFKVLIKSIFERKDFVRSFKIWLFFWIGLVFVVIGMMFYIKVFYGKSLKIGVFFYGIFVGFVVFLIFFFIFRVKFLLFDLFIGVELIFRCV